MSVNLRSLQLGTARYKPLWISDPQFTEVYRIQGFDVSGVAAVFDSVPHFRGHMQEIVHMTRLHLGDAYKFAWTPTTPEQGAPA
jgi:hypothetical protein